MKRRAPPGPIRRLRQPGQAATAPATPSEAPGFDLDTHIFFWFTQVISRRDRQLAAELKPFGLRVPEWRALASLHSKQRLSMSQLADFAAIDRTTLTRTVDRMARAGWVVRLSDAADMRVKRLALTGEGERLFARLWPVVGRLNEVALAGLPEPVIALLRWALEEMRRSLDQSLSGAAAAPSDRRAA